MKLARKLAALLLPGILLILAVALWWSMHRDLALLDADIRRDHQVLGRAVSAMVVQTWNHEGEDAARKLVAEIDRQEPSVSIQLERPDPADAQQSEALRGPGLLQRERPQPQGAPLLDSWLRVPVGGPETLLLHLSESTADRHRFVVTQILRALFTALGITVVGGLITVAVGALVVGRRVDALVRFTRQISAGELSPPVHLPGNDELSEVGDALNRMVDDLAASQASLTQANAAQLRAMEQLRHADRLATVGKLASGIAHELGTQLNVVSGRAKMIHSDANLPEAALRNARIIAEQSERMATIIRQLLGFARAQRVRVQTTDLRLLVEQALHLLTPMAKKRSVTLRAELPEAPVTLEVDPGQIHQVLTNLIVNGLQAMQQPGELTVALLPAMPERGEPIRLRVLDEGPGIPEEILPRIFEPFFTTKDVGEGTGLGLSVAWGIVQEHGGTLQASSRPEGGTCFEVTLPSRSPSLDGTQPTV